jgi:hypothetical protein
MPPAAKRIADIDSAYFKAYPRLLVYLRSRGTFRGTFGALFAWHFKKKCPGQISPPLYLLQQNGLQIWIQRTLKPILDY